MRLFKWASFSAIVFAVSATLSVPARASFDIELAIDGGAYVQEAVVGSPTGDNTTSPDQTLAGTYSISDSGATFTLTIESALGDNTNPTSYVASLTGGLKSTVTDGLSHTLNILVSDQNYTLPGPPRTLFAQADNLANVAGVASASVQGFADNNNGFNATSGPAVTSTSSVSLTPLGPAPSTISTAPVPVSGSGTYSLTGVLTLSTSSNIDVSTLTFGTYMNSPEPASLAIWATGLSLLGFSGLRRRRQAMAKAA